MLTERVIRDRKTRGKSPDFVGRNREGPGLQDLSERCQVFRLGIPDWHPEALGDAGTVQRNFAEVGA